MHPWFHIFTQVIINHRLIEKSLKEKSLSSTDSSVLYVFCISEWALNAVAALMIYMGGQLQVFSLPAQTYQCHQNGVGLLFQNLNFSRVIRILDVCLFSWHFTIFVYTLSLAQFLLERSCFANLPTYYAYFLKLPIVINIMIITCIFIIIVFIIILIMTIVAWYIWFSCYHYLYSVQLSALNLRLCL